MKTKHNTSSRNKWSLLLASLAVLIFTGPALADHTMESNIDMVAEEMARWSQQCGSKPLTPEAQAKLSELLMETSQLLRQIAAHTDNNMQTEYNRKIETMKAEWNPFDSRYGN